MINLKDFFDALTYGKAIKCNTLYKVIDFNQCELLNNEDSALDDDVFTSYLCEKINEDYIVDNDCCNIYYSNQLNLYIIDITCFGTPWDSVNVNFNC